MCGLGNGVLSLSSDRWRCHSAGGLSKLTFMDPEASMARLKHTLLACYSAFIQLSCTFTCCFEQPDLVTLKAAAQLTS